MKSLFNCNNTCHKSLFITFHKSKFNIASYFSQETMQTLPRSHQATDRERPARTTTTRDPRTGIAPPYPTSRTRPRTSPSTSKDLTSKPPSSSQSEFVLNPSEFMPIQKWVRKKWIRSDLTELLFCWHT